MPGSGFPMEPDEVRKRLKFAKKGPAGVLLLTRLGKERHLAILAERPA